MHDDHLDVLRAVMMEVICDLEIDVSLSSFTAER
jgi:hypothetical protein